MDVCTLVQFTIYFPDFFANHQQQYLAGIEILKVEFIHNTCKHLRTALQRLQGVSPWLRKQHNNQMFSQ